MLGILVRSDLMNKVVLICGSNIAKCNNEYKQIGDQGPLITISSPSSTNLWSTVPNFLPS